MFGLGTALPQRLHYHQGIPFQDSFYIVGGHTGVRFVNNVYKYEPKTGHWTNMPLTLAHADGVSAAFVVDRRPTKK